MSDDGTRDASKDPERATAISTRPLTRDLMEDLGLVLRGSWGSSCWCMHPRLNDAAMRALPGEGALAKRRRAAMTALSESDIAPGLIGFLNDEPVGWISVAPRGELGRVDASRATPRLDDEAVWVIPCVTVAKTARGKGVAIALIQAAVAHAGAHGAPIVEAYPRAGEARTSDDNAYFGTEPLFRRAGFEVVRGVLENLPRNWTPRVTMRCRPPKSAG
jgi:GNAT superfamily N-acetyltransferase